MASQVSIINTALGRLGANSITSLTDNSAEQILAVNAWDIVRQEVLRTHPWNFAIADIELNQIAGAPEFEYKFAYQLPSNCLRLLQVYGDPVFKLQGKRILTDQSVVKIKYVYDVTDTTLWDASFTDVIAQRLATELAYALTKSQTTADSMFQIYERKLRTAKHIDANEDVLDMLGPNESNFIGVRF